MRCWFRVIALAAAMAAGGWAAAIKLYLTDGEFHAVREYKVEGDRVRFYSTERSQWEEMPLELVDLKRTRAESAALEEARLEEKRADRAEAEAEAAMRREIRLIPRDPGVYWLEDGEARAVKQAEVKVVTDKKRSILKAVSPIPIVSGKSTVEIDGTSAAVVVHGERPELYVRLSQPERFGIVRVAEGKGTRIVERWNVIPVTKEIVQEQDLVEIFRYQVGGDLYKIWPQKPIEPGEYAVIQYTEGKGNTQAWDFRVARGK
ncbi:MAG: hypothetical protein R2729_00620 [Bryobacteraceae bacterium]